MTLQGGAVITNSLDVAQLAPYAIITGDLQIDAPGLTSISLPNLCQLDGTLEAHSPSSAASVQTLDLPALKIAGGIDLADNVTTTLPAQWTALTNLNVPELSALTTTGLNVRWTTQGPGPSLSFPQLVESTSVSLTVNAGLSASVGFPSLQTCATLTVAGLPTLGLPALHTVGTLSLRSVPVIDLGALQSAGSISASAGGAYAFPALTTVGGDIQAIELTGAFSLPVLSTMTGTLAVDAPSVSAPLLTKAGAVQLNGVAAASFPALTTTGAISVPFWSVAYSFNSPPLTPSDSNPTSIGTLSFPNLTSGGTIYLGWDGILGDACPETSPPPMKQPVPAGNLGLVDLDFPLLGPGTTVLFGENPLLPKCHADALLAQVGQAPSSTNEVCALAQCPSSCGGTSCAAPTSYCCNSTCVDLTSDPHNCGGCGNTCTGGCVGSKCAPPACDIGAGCLADMQPGPRGIVSDGIDAYWINSGLGAPPVGAGIMKCAVGGCNDLPTTLATPAPPVGGLAIDATYVYWTENTTGKVLQVPKAGGSVTVLASGQSRPQTIVVEGGHLYWINFGTQPSYADGAIMKMPVGGGSPVPVVASLEWLTGLGANATTLVWANGIYPGGTTVQVPIAGGSQTLLVQGASSSATLAVDATNLYWGDTAGELTQMPLGGGGPITLWGGGSNNVASCLVVDGTKVYWGTSSSNAILETPIGGGPVTMLVTGAGNPGSIAVDATSIYWTEASPSPARVRKAPK